MKNYKKTTAEELTNIIKEDGAESISGKYFNLSGIPRGVFSKHLGDEALISCMLDDQTGPLALISYYVPSYEQSNVYTSIKAAGEINKEITVNGLLQAGSIDEKNPPICILADGLLFNNFKTGSLEGKSSR